MLQAIQSRWRQTMVGQLSMRRCRVRRQDRAQTRRLWARKHDALQGDLGSERATMLVVRPLHACS
jgi:hypothetical protein